MDVLISAEKISDAISEKYQNINVEVDGRKVVRLTGEVNLWQDVVDIGHIAGGFPGVKGVVNEITARDYHKPESDDKARIEAGKAKGIVASADVVIVGAGVTGAAIARDLSKYDIKIILLEKASDISEGTTKANNGMIHSGYDTKPGSLKAKLCVAGNAMYDKWQEELGFHMVRSGSFVAGFDEEDDAYLQTYLERGKENGVPGIEILSGDEARVFEPALNHNVKKVLWTPSAAYVEPYEVCEALVENAIDNGLTLMLNTEVLDFQKDQNRITKVITNQGIIETNCVIDAAGVYADDIAEMAGDRFYTIHPRRGSLVILDKKLHDKANKGFIGTPPKNFTKGGGPTCTPEGNPLWGPSAIEVPDKEDFGVDADDVNFVMDKGIQLTEGMGYQDIITYFSGIRASNYIEDFVIEASEVVTNFIHASCIQSPGLASSPAIAERVELIYRDLFPETKKKADYNPVRKVKKPFRECSDKEKDARIAEDPGNGHIVCRCETVTEAEVVEAIHGKIPAHTVDAVKRRTRAGMGRCQAGFCGPRVVEILARELNVSPLAVTKSGTGSEILEEMSREVAL